MKQGIQADFPHRNLQKYGCYFFALLRWAELLRGKEYDNNQQIIDMFDICNKAGWIEDDCFVVNPVAILNQAVSTADFKTLFRTNKPPTDVQYFIAYMKKPEHTHFVLWNQQGKLWDSLDPNRPGGLNYVVDSFRVIK